PQADGRAPTRRAGRPAVAAAQANTARATLRRTCLNGCSENSWIPGGTFLRTGGFTPPMWGGHPEEGFLFAGGARCARRRRTLDRQCRDRRHQARRPSSRLVRRSRADVPPRSWLASRLAPPWRPRGRDQEALSPLLTADTGKWLLLAGEPFFVSVVC